MPMQPKQFFHFPILIEDPVSEGHHAVRLGDPGLTHLGVKGPGTRHLIAISQDTHLDIIHVKYAQ